MKTEKCLADCFTRDNPRKVWTLKDESQSGWLYDAIYEAHDGTMPNDWIYETIVAVCDAIDDGYLGDEDAIHEFADGQVDVYNGVLWDWAAKFQGQALFAAAEDEAKEYGNDGDTTAQLGRIQYFAISRIARTILTAYEANKAEDVEDESAVSS